MLEKTNDKHGQELPNIEQNKFISKWFRFLIPDDFDFQKLQQLIRKRLQLKENQVMYILFKSNKIYGGGNI